MVRVLFSADGFEVSVGGLPADPLEERLEQRCRAQRLKTVVDTGEIGVAVGRVDLLVARLAQRRAVLGLAALLARLEVMKRDQVRGDRALAQRAGAIGPHGWREFRNAN